MSQVIAVGNTQEEFETTSSSSAPATVSLSSPAAVNGVIPFGATVHVYAKSEQNLLTRVMTLTSDTPVATIPFTGTFVLRRMASPVQVAVDVAQAPAQATAPAPDAP